MKILQLKKLFTFILSAIVMFFFSTAQAQIVYTDVDPDQTYSSGNYFLDLNNDGTTDFTLTASSWTHTIQCGYFCFPSTETNHTLKITTAGNNEIGLDAGNSKLDQNTLIDSNSLSWNAGLT